MELKENENLKSFDMDTLKISLPQKRKGLSRYYSGKSRSFECMTDVCCLEDLKKEERPMKRKKRSGSDRNSVKSLSALHMSSRVK